MVCGTLLIAVGLSASPKSSSYLDDKLEDIQFQLDELRKIQLEQQALLDEMRKLLSSEGTEPGVAPQPEAVHKQAPDSEASAGMPFKADSAPAPPESDHPASETVDRASVRIDLEPEPASALQDKAPPLADPESQEGPPKPSDISTIPPSQQYGLGYSLYQEGKYLDAMSAFEKYLEDNPATPLSDNCWYWMGESLRQLELFPEALAAFNHVITEFPQENKVPDSMLRKADVYQSMGLPHSGHSILEDLIKRYPQSEAAREASERLAKE